MVQSGSMSGEQQSFQSLSYGPYSTAGYQNTIPTTTTYSTIPTSTLLHQDGLVRYDLQSRNLPASWLSGWRSRWSGVRICCSYARDPQCRGQGSGSGRPRAAFPVPGGPGRHRQPMACMISLFSLFFRTQISLFFHKWMTNLMVYKGRLNELVGRRLWDVMTSELYVLAARSKKNVHWKPFMAANTAKLMRSKLIENQGSRSSQGLSWIGN